MSCEQVGDKAYFSQLVACFQQHGRMIFDWLTHLKTDIEVSKPPLTKFKKDLTIEGLSKPIKFIREILEHKLTHIGLVESGGILDVDEKNATCLRVKSTELYEAYRAWQVSTQGTAQRYVSTLQTFIDEVAKVKVLYKKRKSHKSDKPWSTTGFKSNMTTY